MNKKSKQKQRLNSLIPMQDPEGGRCFVNHWDVQDRKADGWTVVGDERRHVNRVSAPVENLDPKNDPKESTGSSKGTDPKSDAKGESRGDDKSGGKSDAKGGAKSTG